MATPTAASTGTATPLELDPEQAQQSLKISLADLAAKAAALFAQKKYEDAAEQYARAAEMQAEMNGEMSPDNAEILYLYGRTLFKVGQSKSDVLGGSAPQTKNQAKPKAPKKKAAANGTKNGEGGSSSAAKAEEKVEKVVAEAAGKEAEKESSAEIKKPMFHFEGDENFVDSDEEDEAEEGEGEGEEEDDDLATAFEVLDLARLLFIKKLEATQAEAEGQEGKGKETAEEGSDNPNTRHLKERLGDTHDLLAEISLENEKYHTAINDAKAALKYKEELYPFESEIIAEAHFKVSLALEFASVTKPSEDDDNNQASDNQSGEVDQKLRDEAAASLEQAIKSTKLKLQNKEVELATLHNPEENDSTREEIANVKEMIADMEQRLKDLRAPPIDINSALGLPSRSEMEKQKADDLVLGSVSEEVKKNANDLTGLVRKKRKADESVAVEEVKEQEQPEAKRAKSEDLLGAAAAAEAAN
ncbi:hypothetical protein QBC40DRAFT_227961 [Triangularia verruculosa]|uniref:Tetratricopeptide SHNi-TPR domain-containing protein n=1 Tax=Triangularia verruculosa TaxID=2587418 RepID=A0AAN7AU81_9PEZI|nr:hypothetical protein QBC40DRAFT_227961 [Triangularia verruculosa]